MIPTWGWPERKPQRTKINRTPDWMWRARPLLDTRPDSERPSAIRQLPLDDGKIDADLKGSAPLDAYLSVTARHQGAVEKLKNSRQMLFRSNFGLVRFTRREGRLIAIHELYTAFADPDAAVPEPPKPAPFMVHEASLGPEDEAPPGELRPRAIEPVKLPE